MCVYTQMVVYSYYYPLPSACYISTKLSSFTLSYNMMVFKEGFVHGSFMPRFIKHFIPKNIFHMTVDGIFWFTEW